MTGAAARSGATLERCLLRPGGTRRGAAGIRAAIVTLMVLGAGAAAACSGSSSPHTPVTTASSQTVVAAPTSTAEPLPTPLGTSGPAPSEAEFLAFARSLDASIQTGDLRQLRDSFQTQHVVCPEDLKAPRGIGGPDCRYPRQEFDGVVVATAMEGAIVPVEEATAMLLSFKTGELPEARDAFGDGRLRVYAVIYNPTIALDDYVFRLRYGAVLTSIVPPARPDRPCGIRSQLAPHIGRLADYQHCLLHDPADRHGRPEGAHRGSHESAGRGKVRRLHLDKALQRELRSLAGPAIGYLGEWRQ